MKRLAFLLMLAAMVAIAPVAGAAVVTFEDVDLATIGTEYTTGEYYYNGSDGAGGFTSGSVSFTTNYSLYGSWDGWAASNTTDITTAGYANQYSAITGSGVDGSDNYGVAYVPLDWQSGTYDSMGVSITFDSAVEVVGTYITNTTYAYFSMLNGDSFAEAFDEDDWFLLTIYGINAEGNLTDQYVDYYLASGTDILDDWDWLDLTSLGEVYGLEFYLSSSDTGDYGMNTPAYFAMDDLEASPVPIPGAIWMLGSGLFGLVAIRRRNA